MLEKQPRNACRLYLGLMRTITDDYGAEFSDSLAYQTICIYVTAMWSASATPIASRTR